MNGTRDSRPTTAVAVFATAATYLYFLLFAEFAFLALATRGGVGAAAVRGVMIVLGVSGVLGGAYVAWKMEARTRAAWLKWSFRGCAVGAALALSSSHRALLLLVAAISGGSLGALTVALAAQLRGALGGTRLGFGIGLGTGIAYALCNVPWIFHARPEAQTALAGLAAALASLLPPLSARPADEGVVRGHEGAVRTTLATEPRAGHARWVLILLALVWLDSAAFYIVQHTESLRATTWHQDRALWANAAIHLAAAVVAGVALDRGRRASVIVVALTGLAIASLQLNGTLGSAVSPAWLYTAGVSLYSVALVEVPARAVSATVAAWIFGVAGWGGSALGIGMAQDLARIPTGFVLTAAGLVAAALAWRRWFAVAAMLAIAATPVAQADDSMAAGRETYIAEGCIHCHSQYIRPRVATEVLNWGPATPLRKTLSATPPLIGTRRQGPDLSHVGNRRSPEWNRLHLIAPQRVSPGSRMPSYAHLFAPGDARGEALVAYLSSLGADSFEERQQQIAAWKPAQTPPADLRESSRLFQRLCAQCHGSSGRGDGELSAELSIRPPNWSQGGWRRLLPGADDDQALSRIIKFGLPGVPMAGHEYLPDAEIVGLARYVRMLHDSALHASAAAQP